MRRAAFFTIVISLMISMAGCSAPTSQPPPPPPPIPPIEPAPGPLSTQGYVYYDKLGYGFEYPGGWEFSISIDKDVEQCDPSLHYETYTCVDFPDENLKKHVGFTKRKDRDGVEVLVTIDFIVKSAAGLQEVKDEFKKVWRCPVCQSSMRPQSR